MVSLFPAHYTRRSALRLGSLGLLSQVAGCAGFTRDKARSPTTTTGGTTTSQDETTTNTSHAVNDCGFRLTVETADETDVDHAKQILHFENLSSNRQQEFTRALKNGSVELNNGTQPYSKGTANIIKFESTYYKGVLVSC